MRLSKLIEDVEYEEVIFEGEWDGEIEELVTDSRVAGEDSLFFCLNGGENDGHLYAAQAIRGGAKAVVTEKRLSLNVPQILVKSTRKALAEFSRVFHGKPDAGLKIVGITGTNGKTTTAHMLAAILEKSGKNVGLIGTLGIRYAGKELPSRLTTPDPIELHKTFADMCKSGVEYVVMEVSAHALYYEKVAGIEFVACIFTNLTQDHLDFFPSMEEYKKSKRKLFTSPRSIYVLNGDDDVGREIIAGKAANNVVVYGMQTPADAFAIVTEEGLSGCTCMLNINDELCRISLSLPGLHNVYNALAAASCAMALGCSADAVSRGLSELKGVEGRLERIGAYHGGEIFVDFAHTPDGLAKSLDTLRSYCKGRLLCLFGCGGNRDRSKRPIMGETAAKKADFSILTSDNPRYEDPLDIVCDIEKGHRRFSVCFVVVPDRKRAIEYALELLAEGDILLLAGKGGEKEQEVMGIKYPFNDHAIVKELLGKKGK